MPIPPVSQCRNRQTATADQEKYRGFNARRAPMWRAAIQRTGPQAMPAEAGRSVVVVVILNLVWFVNSGRSSSTRRTAELARPAVSSGNAAKGPRPNGRASFCVPKSPGPPPSVPNGRLRGQGSLSNLPTFSKEKARESGSSGDVGRKSRHELTMTSIFRPSAFAKKGSRKGEGPRLGHTQAAISGQERGSLRHERRLLRRHRHPVPRRPARAP